MLTFAHVVNVIVPPPTSDLVVAQPVTLQSMLVAQQLYPAAELWAVCYADEQPTVPPGFQRTKPLTRSLADHRRGPKLAFVKDILDALYEATTAEYMVFTNVDIGLQPYFYSFAEYALTSQPYDALIINKRIIPDYYTSPTQLPGMWAEIGKRHQGYDCFVWRRDLYPQFRLDSVCVGLPYIGATLKANLGVLVRDTHVFLGAHVTFHIGVGLRSGGNPSLLADVNHNARAGTHAVAQLTGTDPDILIAQMIQADKPWTVWEGPITATRQRKFA